MLQAAHDHDSVKLESIGLATKAQLRSIYNAFTQQSDFNAVFLDLATRHTKWPASKYKGLLAKPL